MNPITTMAAMFASRDFKIITYLVLAVGILVVIFDIRQRTQQIKLNRQQLSINQAILKEKGIV